MIGPSTVGGVVDEHAHGQEPRRCHGPGRRCTRRASRVEWADAEWNEHRTRQRRVSRAHERGVTAVMAAIPDGYERPKRVSEWRELALAHPLTAHMNARSWRTWCAFVHAVSNAVHVQSMTTEFSWARLAEAMVAFDPLAGHSRRTIAYYLRRAQDAHLLGHVASGRLGRYAPTETNTTEDGEVVNDTAIYVLLAPEHVAEEYVEDAAAHAATDPSVDAVARYQLAATVSSADEICTPPSPPVSDRPPARKHSRARGQIEPLRGTSLSRPATPAGGCADLRSVPQWTAQIATLSLDQRGRLFASVRHELRILIGLSDAYLAHCVRPFVDAGWTMRDVVRAIDWKPDGTAWTLTVPAVPGIAHEHVDDGRSTRRARTFTAREMHRPGDWLRSRLAHWIGPDGTVLRSPSQRSQDEHVAALARHRARQELAERQAVEWEAAQHSPTAAAAREQARAAIRAAQLRRTRATARTGSVEPTAAARAGVPPMASSLPDDARSGHRGPRPGNVGNGIRQYPRYQRSTI